MYHLQVNNNRISPGLSDRPGLCYRPVHVKRGMHCMTAYMLPPENWTIDNVESRTGWVVDDCDSLGGPETFLTRRQVLDSGVGMAANAGAMGAMVGSANAAIGADLHKRIEGASLTGPSCDLTTVAANVDAYAKVWSNLDMEYTHYGWIDGHAMEIAPGRLSKSTRA